MTTDLIDLLIMFAVLPCCILVDSAKRLKRFAWEWIPPVMMIMSIWAAVLNFIVFPKIVTGIQPLNFGIYTTLVLTLSRKFLSLGGAGIVWALYMFSEFPSIRDPLGWRILRAASSVAVGVLFITTILDTRPLLEIGSLGNAVFLVVLTVSLLAFAVSQIFIAKGRELDVDAMLNEAIAKANAEDVSERKAASFILSKIATQSKEAKAKLVELLRDSDPGVRNRAWKDIHRFRDYAIETEPDTVTSILREHLASEFRRTDALDKIAHHGLAAAARPLVPEIITLMGKTGITGFKSEAHAALVAIAGEDHGKDTESWRHWSSQLPMGNTNNGE